MPSKTQTRVITGLAIGAAVAAAVYFFGEGTAGAAEPLGPEPDPDQPPPPDEAHVPHGGGKVPGKTTAGPYNQQMFPSKASVQGRLAGIAPGYFGALSDATYPATVGAFQADWNEMARQGVLAPSRLNSSRLAQDEVPGPQTLRALEWAAGMGWIAKMTEAGLQA